MTLQISKALALSLIANVDALAALDLACERIDLALGDDDDEARACTKARDNLEDALDEITDAAGMPSWHTDPDNIDDACQSAAHFEAAVAMLIAFDYTPANARKFASEGIADPTFCGRHPNWLGLFQLVHNG